MSIPEAAIGSARELTSTSYAVLGMVALRGPSTPYELKRALGRITNQFWTVPHILHYREAVKLEGMGLLSSRQEPSGRRRRVYRTTPAGRKALQAWLATTASSMEIRDEGELKLLFGELGTKEDIVALARDQADQYRVRLAELDATADALKDRKDLEIRLAPLKLGRALYKAGIAFWDDIARDPPRKRADAPKQGRRPRASSREGGI